MTIIDSQVHAYKGKHSEATLAQRAERIFAGPAAGDRRCRNNHLARAFLQPPFQERTVTEEK